MPDLCLSRRELLGGGLGLLVPTLPAAGAAEPGPLPPATGDGRVAGDPASGESLALARHVAQSRLEDLPAAAAAAGKRSILDALGVSLAASGLEPACQPFIDFALAGGAGVSVVLGTGRRAPLLMAALANGALAHALDYEDAHEASRTHPNAAPVAVALTMADGIGGVSGREFLQAIAIGSDVVCRLAMAQGNAAELPLAFYPPAIVGTLGATATAARLLRLTPGQVLDAFSLALCQNSCSAEILSEPWTDLRAVRDGPCAQAALQAALLAQRGVRGFRQPIEGERAFYAMYAGGRHVRGRLLQELGTRFEGQYVEFKAWPACRDNHAYIQAALEGMARDAVDPSAILEVRAYVEEINLIVCEPALEKRRPRAAIDAKFSLYYTVAAAVVDRQVTLGSYGSAQLLRPTVLALADRIQYVIDPARARPDAGGWRRLLEVRMRDGSTRQWGIRALRGSPEYPLDDATLVGKFTDCGRAARRPLATARLESLAHDVLALEQVRDMRSITRDL